MPAVIDWPTSLLSFCTTVLPNGAFGVSRFGGFFLHLIKHPVIALVLPYGFIFHYFSTSLFLCISFSFCLFISSNFSCFFSLCSLPSQQKTDFSACPPGPVALQTHWAVNIQSRPGRNIGLHFLSH